jgi:hypothetical protein
MKYTGDINLSSTFETLIQKPIDPRLHFEDAADVLASVDENYSRWYSGMKILLHDTGKEYFWWDVDALPSGYSSAAQLLEDDVLYSDYPDADYVDKYFNFFEVLGATVSKSTVGLSNVDNTSDINKPISTLTQAALDDKAEINDATISTTTTWSSDKIEEEIQTIVDNTLDITTYDPSGIGENIYDVDNHVDGTINKVFTATEKTKLSNITEAAEPNNISDSYATDLTDGGDSGLHYHSTDRERSNHSGTQLASTISDFANTVNTTVNSIEFDVNFSIEESHNKAIINCQPSCSIITLPTLIEGFICYIFNNNGSDLAINTLAVGSSPVANQTLSVLIGVPTVGWVLKVL